MSRTSVSEMIRTSVSEKMTTSTGEKMTTATGEKMTTATGDARPASARGACVRVLTTPVNVVSAASFARGAAVARALLLVALTLACGAGAAAQRRGGTYANPVAAGDFPDPSVVRVGADYWAVATSSEWAPEFPVLHSRDLVNWRLVGAVFQRRPAWSVGNYWAPEISHWRGRFYVYYTARKQGGPLCVAVATAASATGPYTDHGPLVCQEVGSIDGFPVTDERGRRFLLWKEDGNSVSKPTPIWAQQLNPNGTRLVGRRQELIRNDQPWEKHSHLPYGDLVEGPALVRRDGWFYMFYSGNFCCARECNYMVGVARARRLLGPWEKHPANPIMAGNDAWKCPGHGTVVADAAGRDWFFYHAMHAKDFVYVGRQALLDEVVWGRDGWPTINGGRGPSGRADGPAEVARPARGERRAETFLDEFTGARLRPGWQWPQANEPTIRIDAARRGWLSLAPAAAGQGAGPVAAVVARSTTAGDYRATAAVDAASARGGAGAGLAAYGDAENAVGVSLVNGRAVVWRREKKGERVEQTELASVEAPGGAVVRLRMTARAGRFYRFSVAGADERWRDVGDEVDGTFLPPWDRGVRIALVAGGTGRARGAAVRFDWLRVEPAHPPHAARN